MVFTLAARNNPVADMNITPLVDVMLVLLIIFMVTLPLRTQSLAFDLPLAHPYPPPQAAPPIALQVDAAGQVKWNGSAVPMAALEGALKVEALRYAHPSDQPQIRIDVDPGANYGSLAQVLVAAQNAGMVNVTFMDATTR